MFLFLIAIFFTLTRKVIQPLSIYYPEEKHLKSLGQSEKECVIALRKTNSFTIFKKRLNEIH